ncbi:MAG: heme biosynthesis HemY N-terminal domain-containing protein, partial [Amaricoccus sp.]
MLWSVIKVLIFIGIATALAFGALYLVDTPGEVRVAFGGREFYLSPIGFVIGLMLLLGLAFLVLKLIGLLVAVARFLLGDETAISRYFARNRERRGIDALSDGLVALASGDPKTALKKTAKAERLLNRPDVTGLVNAQAAELNGDRTRATQYYKEMLGNDRTRFVAVQGLMKQQLDEGDTYTALELAKKAFALRPSNPAILRTLFDLQTQREDWAGARGTLTASTQARLLPRDV